MQYIPLILLGLFAVLLVAAAVSQSRRNLKDLDKSFPEDDSN